MIVCQICDPKKTVLNIMHTFKQGKLHSKNKKEMVTDRTQAVAIALSASRQCMCKNKK